MSTYGEPWRRGNAWLVTDANRDMVCDHAQKRTHLIDRAIACVNALAGIADPEKFVAATKELMIVARPGTAINKALDAMEAAMKNEVAENACAVAPDE